MNAGLPIRQGQYWWVDDAVITFPENRGREPHERRRGCIIVQGNETLDLCHPVVLVVPTSSQIDRKETYDVLIPNPPAPQRECVARIAHIQPILRTDLASLVAPLPSEWSDQVIAAVLHFLGVHAEAAPDIAF